MLEHSIWNAARIVTSVATVANVSFLRVGFEKRSNDTMLLQLGASVGCAGLE